ncbi:MAG: TrmH family RNA methyltransferase [Candidatus Saccharimonadales bacterium]
MSRNRKIVLVIHNVRSAHNVGSLIRTADGLDVEKVYLTGYTPYPEAKNDERLPHIRQRMAQQIHKTALGAEERLDWQHIDNIDTCLQIFNQDGYLIAALEQTDRAKDLNAFRPVERMALLVGNEVSGLDEDTLSKALVHLRIPMLGQKESFNVAVAAAMALYHLRGDYPLRASKP